MSSIVVSEVEFAHPGGEPLFFDVSFTVSPGEHAAIVGGNGAGKSTLVRILAGELPADAGTWALGGTALYMPQDVGMATPDASVREMLVDAAPLRCSGRSPLLDASAPCDGRDDVPSCRGPPRSPTGATWRHELGALGQAAQQVCCRHRLPGARRSAACPAAAQASRAVLPADSDADIRCRRAKYLDSPPAGGSSASWPAAARRSS